MPTTPLAERPKFTLDELKNFALEMRVKDMTISFSAKKTIKVGEDFRSFEAFESWTMAHPEQDLVYPELVQYAAAYWAPKLIAKVYFGLFAGGVMTLSEAQMFWQEATRAYQTLTEQKDGKGSGSSDLRRTGDTGSPTTERSDTGSNVPSGTDDPLPATSGQGEQPVHGSESGVRVDPASSPQPEGSVGSNIGSPGTDSSTPSA